MLAVWRDKVLVPEPMVMADVLAVPMLIVPAVWVAVPTSRVMLPELDMVPVALPDWMVMLPELDVVPPVALPDWMVMLLLLVEAVDVLLELTLLAEPALKAYGTPVSLVRLFVGASISPSQVGVAVWLLPPTFMVSQSS